MTFDPDELERRVLLAQELMGQGLSLRKAAVQVGVPRSTLSRRLSAGVQRRDRSGCSETAESIPSGRLPAAVPYRSNGRYGRESRDTLGRFAQGNRCATGGKSRETQEARRILEEFSPRAARKLIEAFKKLSADQPELLLAFAREILDRALGKPKAAVELSGELEIDEESIILQSILTNPRACRLAQELACVMEGDPGESCTAPEQGALEGAQTPV